MNNIKREFKGIWIPAEIWLSDELSLQEKVMIVEIDSLTNNEKGYCWASNGYFAKFFGLSKTRISHVISTMHQKELIDVWDITIINKTTERRIKLSENILNIIKKKHTKEGVADLQGGVAKSSKRVIHINNKNKKIFSKEKTVASGEARVVGKKDVNKRTLPKIVKKEKHVDSKKNILDPKDRQVAPKKKTPKSKYKHTLTDEKNYKWLVDAGATKHDLTKQAGLNTLDSIHALLSPKGANSPYKYAKNNTQEYIDFKWTIEDVIEAFIFQLKYDKFKPIKNIANFIFTRGGYNGGIDYSQLIKWHSAMKKGIIGRLTEEGEILLKSLKQRKVRINGLESRSDIFNKISKDILEVSSKYVFVANDKATSNGYGYGITSIASEYIKELTTKNNDYDLKWINTGGWVKDTLIPMALKRNILKLKNRGRGINS